MAFEGDNSEEKPDHLWWSVGNPDMGHMSTVRSRTGRAEFTSILWRGALDFDTASKWIDNLFSYGAGWMSIDWWSDGPSDVRTFRVRDGWADELRNGFARFSEKEAILTLQAGSELWGSDIYLWADCLDNSDSKTGREPEVGVKLSPRLLGVSPSRESLPFRAMVASLIRLSSSNSSISREAEDYLDRLLRVSYDGFPDERRVISYGIAV